MTSPKRFAVASFLAAVLAALFTAFAPLGTTCSSSGTPGGPAGEEVCRNVSIFQHDGSWVLVVVSVPVLFALVPVLLRRRAARVVAAVLLWAFCVVGLAVHRCRDLVFARQGLTHLVFGALGSAAATVLLYALLRAGGAIALGPGWAALKVGGSLVLGAVVVPLVFATVAVLDRRLGNLQPGEA